MLVDAYCGVDTVELATVVLDEPDGDVEVLEVLDVLEELVALPFALLLPPPPHAATVRSRTAAATPSKICVREILLFKTNLALDEIIGRSILQFAEA
jgi:hypothetical protein